jgi:hypothetical protein
VSVSEAKLEHGIPLFLSQLCDALGPVAAANALHLVEPTHVSGRIAETAALHGHELLRDGFTVGQVVHGYGDVCQVVTELATELGAPISTGDFQAFNRCLDDAIAGAVTAYAAERERALAYEGTERLGVLAHELRNLLNTSILSFDVIKRGTVGVGGSTGAMHARSLAALSALVERALAEVRLEAGIPSLERISIVGFIEEIAVSASLQAEVHGVSLTVTPGDTDAAVDADFQLLMSAVSNLLQNAFRYTRPRGHVWLAARATEERVFIDVRDECGGLPPGKPEELFGPFKRRSSGSSGLGLGLSIAVRAARANDGEISVRDLPGNGCIFTIDLPRKPPSTPVFRVLPHGTGSAGDGGKGMRRGAHSREPRSRSC